MTSPPRFFIIDGSSLVFRAFYALPSLSTPAGLPTNAIFGFAKMLLKIKEEKRPDCLAMTFDTSAPTLRHAEYEQYKANRAPMPETLSQQLPYIQRLVSAFRIPLLAEEGYEADDLIGTLATMAHEAGWDVTIVSGDKDMFQLIAPGIRVWDTMKEKVYEEKDVRERFGVDPTRIVEIMGLMGDPIDNIPGVPGIGEKTAITLISEFGTIENLLANLDRVKRPSLRDALRKHAEQARMSLSLVRIRRDCPIRGGLEAFRVTEPDREGLISLFRELGFTSLLASLSVGPPSSPPSFTQITTRAQGEDVRREIQTSGEVALALSSHKGECTGVAFTYQPGRTLFVEKGLLAPFKTLLEDPSLKKYGHDLKPILLFLKNAGIDIDLKGISSDTLIASYLLSPTRRVHTLSHICLETLGRAPSSPEGSWELACEESALIYDLARRLPPLLAGQELDRLFSQIELPLIPVLAGMERNGCKVDREALMTLSHEVTAELDQIERKVYTLAGTQCNLNSPKQLSDLLFGKLGLTPIKKTKTGYSTDEDVLQQLALHHEIAREILTYRQLNKLKSTYIDVLPDLINPVTGRIHTSWNQTGTATGRLSSSDPNLQNIPVKGEWGKRIREAFIPEPGWLFLSADYNQIELRLLAHLSQDERLISAFRQGEDIHLATASELFGLPKEAITSDMRRAAKTVNFGILYGISPYGLSTNVGIPQDLARRFIDDYFSGHPGVKAYIDKTLEEARERGYVATLFKRRRPVPDLTSRDSHVRHAAERVAINSPIQGSAADIIKMAMIQIARSFHEKRLSSLMLLQIHDELLFEVPPEELDTVKALVRKEMEGVVELSVPITVDIGIGHNWGEAAPH